MDGYLGRSQSGTRRIFLHKSYYGHKPLFLLVVSVEVESVSKHIFTFMRSWQAVFQGDSCSTFSQLSRHAALLPSGFVLCSLTLGFFSWANCTLGQLLWSMYSRHWFLSCVAFAMAFKSCFPVYKSFVICMYCKYFLLGHSLPFHFNSIFLMRGA